VIVIFLPTHQVSIAQPTTCLAWKGLVAILRQFRTTTQISMVTVSLCCFRQTEMCKTLASSWLSHVSVPISTTLMGAHRLKLPNHKLLPHQVLPVGEKGKQK